MISAAYQFSHNGGCLHMKYIYIKGVGADISQPFCFFGACNQHGRHKKYITANIVYQDVKQFKQASLADIRFHPFFINPEPLAYHVKPKPLSDNKERQNPEEVG